MELRREDLDDFCAGQFAHLRQLAGQKAAHDFARLAHSLASSSANVGARELRVDALRIEIAGRTGQWAKVETMFVGLDRQWLTTKAAREHYRAVGPVPAVGA